MRTRKDHQTVEDEKRPSNSRGRKKKIKQLRKRKKTIKKMRRRKDHQTAENEKRKSNSQDREKSTVEKKDR